MITKEYMFYGWEKADVKDERGLTPRDYYDLLEKIWTVETCAPRLRKDWNERITVSSARPNQRTHPKRNKKLIWRIKDDTDLWH